LARELSQPYTLAVARYWATLVFPFRRAVLAVHEQADAAVAFATDQGLPLWAAWGTRVRGWALAMQAQGDAKIA
jgi:hypothetical protein